MVVTIIILNMYYFKYIKNTYIKENNLIYIPQKGKTST